MLSINGMIRRQMMAANNIFTREGTAPSPKIGVMIKNPAQRTKGNQKTPSHAIISE